MTSSGKENILSPSPGPTHVSLTEIMAHGPTSHEFEIGSESQLHPDSNQSQHSSKVQVSTFILKWKKQYSEFQVGPSPSIITLTVDLYTCFFFL